MREEGRWHKDEASWVRKACDQARQFKDNYKDFLSAQVAEQYPDLYQYVLSTCASGTTFITGLGQRFKQAIPALNLLALINEVDKSYSYYLRWGKDPERYQAIIDGIGAEYMLKVMDLDKIVRYATNFQNCLIKGLTSLVAMDQHQQLMGEESVTYLEYADDANNVIVVEEGEIKNSSGD